VVQSRVKRIKFLDSKLGPTIALLVEKDVIASFRDIDPYSGAIKVLVARVTVRVPTIQFLNTSFHTSSFSFLKIYKNLRSLDVTVAFYVVFDGTDI